METSNVLAKETKELIPNETIVSGGSNLEAIESNIEVKDEIQSSETKLIEDMDLDFEEISDGELEEEARVKGLGDALGVDWASLVQDSRNKLKKDPTQETTAKQRWQPHRILLDIGISYQMAGEAFANEIINDAKIKLKNEIIKKENSIKVEKDDENDFIKKENESDELNKFNDLGEESQNIKTENDIKTEETAENLNQITHKIAVVQVSVKKEMVERSKLFVNASGLTSRALSARRDLQLRRKLCGLPITELSSNVINRCKPDTEYANMAIRLFEKSMGKVS